MNTGHSEDLVGRGSSGTMNGSSNHIYVGNIPVTNGYEPLSDSDGGFMIEEEDEEPVQQRASTLQIGIQPRVAFNSHQHCVTPDGYDDFYSQMNKSSSLPMPRTSSVRSLPAQFDEPIAWKDGMQGTPGLHYRKGVGKGRIWL